MGGNNKKSRVFSIVDLFVAVFIVLMAVALIYRFGSSGTSFSANNRNINYTVKVASVRDFTFEYYMAGLKCYDKQTNKYIGTIKSVRKEPFYELTELLDGSAKLFEKPGIITVFVEIEALGNETDTAYFAEGTYEVKVGSELFLTTKYVEVVGKIDSVKTE